MNAWGPNSPSTGRQPKLHHLRPGPTSSAPLPPSRFLLLLSLNSLSVSVPGTNRRAPDSMDGLEFFPNASRLNHLASPPAVSSPETHQQVTSIVPRHLQPRASKPVAAALPRRRSPSPAPSSCRHRSRRLQLRHWPNRAAPGSLYPLLRSIRRILAGAACVGPSLPEPPLHPVRASRT